MARLANDVASSRSSSRARFDQRGKVITLYKARFKVDRPPKGTEHFTRRTVGNIADSVARNKFPANSERVIIVNPMIGRAGVDRDLPGTTLLQTVCFS